MHKTAILAVTIVLAALTALGCGRPALPGQMTPGADSWTTYTSPDARVRFDHPSTMNVLVRPREDDAAQHLALSASTPDESVQFTLVLRLSDGPLPGYCEWMMDDLADGNTRAVTGRQDISLGDGRGIRQEFREGGGVTPVELIEVSLDARPAYVHMTCGYPATGKADLRPVCERIVGSLMLKK